jgi:glycosyltransferase involved in cell wall biosynthesis
VKLAVVVQRYGPSINGGAELHARYVAEHLARHAEVEVLTTCASDYVTWRNELPPGVEQIHNVPVRRFRVKHERDPLVFGRLSTRVFHQVHSIAEELDWLAAEGPTAPSLVQHLAKHGKDYDYCLFFSYRYYHAYHGVHAVPSRAILVPTAERDPAVGV